MAVSFAVFVRWLIKTIIIIIIIIIILIIIIIIIIIMFLRSLRQKLVLIVHMPPSN